MEKGLHLLAEKIRSLREQLGLTQAELAKKLGLTRSSINAWEMGLSVPSTPLIVDLSRFFGISTDFLLGIEEGSVVKVGGLSPKEVAIIVDIISCFTDNKSDNA